MSHWLVKFIVKKIAPHWRKFNAMTSSLKYTLTKLNLNIFTDVTQPLPDGIPTPHAGQAFSKKQGAMPARLASPLRAAKFALKSEWQRRNDRKSIGASSQWLTPLLSEPATQHGPGIVGDIGERSDAHPICESESNSTRPMALPFINYCGG